MLTRAALVIVIAASLAVCALSLTKIKQRTVKLQRDLATQTELRQDAETQLATTKTTLAKTEETLKGTQATLQSTNERLDGAVAQIASQTKQVNQLKHEVTAANELYATTVQQHSVKMEEAEKRIKSLEDQLAPLLAAKGEKIKRDRISQDFSASVATFDPKWKFVVLNAGERKGAIPNAELLVSRNGKLVGKVMIKSVEKDTCIANVMPGWELGEIQEGDMVFPPRDS